MIFDLKSNFYSPPDTEYTEMTFFSFAGTPTHLYKPLKGGGPATANEKH